MFGLVANIVFRPSVRWVATRMTYGVGESYGVVEGVGIAVELLGTGRVWDNGIRGGEFGDGGEVVAGVVVEETEVGSGLVVGFLARKAPVG